MVGIKYNLLVFGIIVLTSCLLVGIIGGEMYFEDGVGN